MKMYIGIPKETSFQENRLALTPHAIGLLVNNGHEIFVESGAGNPSKYSDTDYSEMGALIVQTAEEAYKADYILKVEPPTEEEFKFLRPGQTLFSAIQSTTIKLEYLKGLINKRINAIAFEYIKDESNTMPIVRSMSEITGSTVMLVAAELLSSTNNGRGIILGGITGVPPTQVVILGAGTVAEYATRTALGLGAEVKIFDTSIFRLRRLKHSLNREIFTSIISPAILASSLKTADVVVGAISPEKGTTTYVVPEELIRKMKPNSVIIDVSIDQGGCFETSKVTTHLNPTFKVHEVIHYCVPNISSRVARTATKALSNTLAPILLSIGEKGGFEQALWEDNGLRNGVYSYKGHLTNQFLAEKFSLKHQDISLMIISRI